MRLGISGIRFAGALERERVVLEVAASTDLGSYLLLISRELDDGSISNRIRHTYWFPDETVTAGDLVVVYTKAGDDHTVENGRGTETHFFYMGRPVALFGNPGSAAVIAQIRDWASQTRG